MIVPKRKGEEKAPSDQVKPIQRRRRKPAEPKITIATDPSILDDFNKIEALLGQHKTWRSEYCGRRLTHREIANYFENNNAETIKKRYNTCKKVIMESFSQEEVPRL
jgi:hypothetical protein